MIRLMFPQHRARLPVALLAAAALLAACGGCARNPVTGERELSLISEQQEIAMGQQAAQQVAQQLGLVEDEELQQYVSRIGQRLAADSERPGLPWSFAVVDDPTPNAFALPGGPIFVTRGMMALMNSEAELASVLGHEIAHVTARHSVQQISKQQLAQLGLGVGMILAPELAQFGDLAAQGLDLLFLKYGRDAEREADELGFRYALEEGYDVREMADVFAALQRSSEMAGASRLPGWLATHPAEPERIRAVEQRVAALDRPLADTRGGQAEYLQQLDGLVYGDDPRHGFFREGTFYHPELKFRFQVPQDWRTQNMPQMVAAISPQKNAAFQLTLVPGGLSAEQAAQKFLQGQNIRGQSARERINGIPAVVTLFQAQAQQGIVQGYTVFLEYGGNTYQLVGYAPQQAFGQADRVLQQIVGSFAPLDDPRFLNVQPRRIDIVQLEKPTSIASLAAREPGGVDAKQMAVLNQVDDAQQVLPAGTRVKVIRGEKFGD